MSFQATVNLQSAPAVAGDFASTNPVANILSPTGGTPVTGPAGVTVGLMAWMAPTGIVTNAKPAGGLVGMVAREQQALITTWLGESSNLIPAGLPVAVFSQGDFWGAFAAGATQGQYVFASDTTGALTAAAKGATVAGSTETHFVVATSCGAGELAKITSWAN